MIPPFYTQRQLARVESTGSSIVGTNVVYTFRSHPYINASYNGIVIIKLGALPSGATTQTIQFDSGNGAKNLTVAGGAQATAADIAGAGVILVYYDSTTGTIQLIA